MPADVTFQVQRFMVDSGEDRTVDSRERQYIRRGAAEFIGMVFHWQSITHIDAMSHYSWQRSLYNGKPASMITSRESARTHSIEAAYSGIVTRGVLLDLPKLRNVGYLDPNEPVMPVDLLDAEESQGVDIEEGGILFVRIGNYRMRLDSPPAKSGEPMTACQMACAPLFKERGIVILGTDTSNDFRPSHYNTVGSPLHTMCLVTMGLWLIDNANKAVDDRSD